MLNLFKFDIFMFQTAFLEINVSKETADYGSGRNDDILLRRYSYRTHFHSFYRKINFTDFLTDFNKSIKIKNLIKLTKLKFNKI